MANAASAKAAAPTPAPTFIAAPVNVLGLDTADADALLVALAVALPVAFLPAADAATGWLTAG